VTVSYLSGAQVAELHARQIHRFGGATGLRDRGALEAADARPAMTFGGEDLYPDLPAKAAALMHSLVLNHPFVDGNKRVGLHAAIVLLNLNGWEVAAGTADLVTTTLRTAAGELDVEALAIWFRQRSRPRPF
jgi:death-on-curing protein